ncbi:MAG: protein-L-isoaspartate O-methyltransferase family protein [Bacillota bacterium]
MERYQDSLLKKSLPLSERVVEAYYRFPRHVFIPEYPIEEAYEDRALLIYQQAPYVSTISQPSFVLRILDMLKIEPGSHVFELGTGSGWSTALLSYLVGEEGTVTSTEIIRPLAERARELFEQMKVSNVKIFAGDGFEACEVGGPYDRIIFTASSSEIPEKIFRSLKEGGLMVYVQNREGGSDLLLLIKKEDGNPHVLRTIPCHFFPAIRNKESRLQDGTL